MAIQATPNPAVFDEEAIREVKTRPYVVRWPFPASDETFEFWSSLSTPLEFNFSGSPQASDDEVLRLWSASIERQIDA